MQATRTTCPLYTNRSMGSSQCSNLTALDQGAHVPFYSTILVHDMYYPGNKIE